MYTICFRVLLAAQRRGPKRNAHLRRAGRDDNTPLRNMATARAKWTSPHHVMKAFNL